MALGVALPVLVLSQAMPLVHAWRERQLIDEQNHFIETQLSTALNGSIRQAMQRNDRAMLADVLASVTTEDGIQRVRVLNLDGQVIGDSRRASMAATNLVATTADRVKLGAASAGSETGCAECHALPADQRSAMTLAATDGMLQFVAPIGNEAECRNCHADGAPHLGVLLTDVSTRALDEHLASDLTTDFTLALLISIALAIVAYLMLQWLIIRRVERMREPLVQFARGDFSQRLPPGTDELGELAGTFNDMAQQLELFTHNQEARVKVRQRAIVEERERIARELHDGVGQLLGYVNTKAMAIRLLLKSRQIEQAERQLGQLEEATRSVFIDVREAILGLKMAGQAGGLVGGVRDYADQFSRLSDIPVKVTFPPEVRALHLPPETELQLLRIVQEALTNIRKHARAVRAEINARVIDRTLEITISDEGRGFDPARRPTDRTLSFGLATMRERAAAIGADFQLNSRPGGGTVLTIRLALRE